MSFYDCFYKYADMSYSYLFKFVSTYNFKKTLKILNIKMGGKAISEVTKWQIVGLSKDNSKSLRKIAELVGVSEKCVRTTIKNFYITGSIKDKS